MPYGEAAALIRGLTLELDSHYSTESREWDWPVSWATIAELITAETTLNINRDTKKQPEPVHLPRPWDKPDPSSIVSADERAALVAKLKARSAFKGR